MNPLLADDPMTVDLLYMHREAVERTREREDPTYRRPSEATQRFADLTELRDRRQLLARARRGDQVALRVLAAERIDLTEAINEVKAANAVTEAAIRAEAEEEDDLEW